MKKVIVLKVLVGFLFFFAFIQGIVNFFNELDDNKCEMTYMFEYPQYIKISLPESSSSMFPYYNLYVYGEGKQAERYHNGKFNGIPVLFIPGNAGVYKQVRSLASLAYRQSLDSRKGFHFDFFTIDFNEELSALYGGVLDQQTVFASDCITKILSIYNSAQHQHKSLLLIGHSMGGIIAKAVSSEKEFNPFLVNTIITLATPHRSPVVALDEDLANFYHRVNQFWLELPNVTEHVALASIGGADRDIQVRSGLTASKPPTVNALTTEIPTVWLAVDHLCIVWCKQVVKTVVRSLFDMVDPSTQSWIEKVDLRKKILSYHLITRGLGKHFENSQGVREVDFDPDGLWREIVASHFTAHAEMEDKSNTYFMIPLVDNAYRDRLEAVSSGLPIKYWVFACAALAWKNSVRFCERGIDLSYQSLLLPNTGDNVKRKLIYLDLLELRQKGFTHVVFTIPKRHQKGSVIFHVHRSPDRKLEVRFPFSSYIPFMPIGHVAIPNNAMSYNIYLPNLSKSWQSVSFKTRQNSCQTGQNALVRKIIPWSHENQYYLTNRSFSVHLHVPKSPADSEYDSVHLQFINPHPQCNYDIEISTDWIGMWTQLVRFYSPFLLSLVFAIFLHCLSTQLRAKQLKNSVPSTLSCLLNMPVIKLALIPETLSIILGLMNSLKLPVWPSFLTSDESILREDGLGFPLMYLILGGVAWVFAIILTIIIWLGISAGGHILHTFIIRHLRGSFGFSLIVAEIVAMGVSRIPIMISIVLIAITSSTCGSLGLCLGLIVFIWKLFSYYEDELESMLSEEESKEVDDDFRVNLTIALLWFCTAFLSLPTLIVWIKSPSLILQSDHMLLPSYAWSIFGMMALQNLESSPRKRLHGYVASVISALAVLLLLFGLVSIYRIKYFVTAAVMTYAVSKYFM